ncbi:hypothetical protein [Micromonospora aurantiaca (nom. illeg.)]|uniref:hypothetical protein n=1 Tax=Micromonospora aurantiaca (nom. illeg.) TaxID=47850 RepID=UPI003F49F00F
MTGTAAEIDGVALAIKVLKAAPVITDKFGGPDRVSGRNEPPFPHLRVIALPGGDDGRLLWTVRKELQVEAWAHPDGRPGKAALHRLLYAPVNVLLGPERWQRWNEARPGAESYLLLGKTAIAEYGLSLGEALGLSSSPGEGGKTSKPTSPAATSTRGGSGSRRATRSPVDHCKTPSQPVTLALGAAVG